jgi:2'-5' RNA ligase
LCHDGPAEAGHYAVDIAILPPPEVSERAIALSAALPVHESQGLLLGADRLPHITLTQQFVPLTALELFIERVQELMAREPLPLRVTGGGKGSNSVWMSIERAAPLVRLHEQLLQATQALEVTSGDASAFLEDACPFEAPVAQRRARDRDVRWVREFRRESSFDRFTPHITLGHASDPPFVEPMDFTATTIAVCHLGRFCTCRRIIRAWDLR